MSLKNFKIPVLAWTISNIPIVEKRENRIEYLLKIFNIIQNNGIFSASWNKVVIAKAGKDFTSQIVTDLYHLQIYCANL